MSNLENTNKYFIYVMIGIGLMLMYKFVNRDSLIYVIGQSLPAKEAGLLTGIILGDKSGFDKNFYKDLKISGVVHLVVVSGSNVMLLVGGVIENLAGYINRKKAILLGLLLGWWYVFLVGAEIPVVRAILLVSIYYWAQLLGRKYNLTRGVGLTAMIILISDFGAIKEVSFWLSFLAFIAIVLNKKKNILWSTIWVSLWITPIIAFNFKEISLVAPISNVLVLAVAEVVMVIGVLGISFGIMLPVLGKLILWLALPFLKYFVWIVEGLASVKWASVKVDFNIWMFVGWYLVLGWFLVRKYKLFGKLIIKGRTHRSARTLNHPNLNDIGEMVNYWWNEIPNHFQNIKLDESVIMPNHMHGIIVIQNFIINRADLGNVIQWFKTMVTNEYIKNVKNLNWPRFNKRLWQRNYHERIIRDKRELEIKRLYIRNNPKNWSKKKS